MPEIAIAQPHCVLSPTLFVVESSPLRSAMTDLHLAGAKTAQLLRVQSMNCYIMGFFDLGPRIDIRAEC